MSASTVPVYEIGWIPDIVMRENTLAFQIKTEKRDPTWMTRDPTIEHAIDTAQSTVTKAHSGPKGKERAQDPIANQLVLRQPLEKLIPALDDVTKLARKLGAGATQLAGLVEAKDLATKALETVLRTGNAPLAESRPHAEKDWREVLHQVESAAACLSSGIKALSEAKMLLLVEPQPFGPFLWNPDTGDFKYTRDPRDRTPLRVTFSAGAGGKLVRHAVAITPVLPAATNDAEIIDRRITQHLFETQMETRYSPNPKTLILTGLDVTLDEDLLATDLKDITVYAHIVHVQGNLKSVQGGKNLGILARYVQFADQASIDVSGKRGLDLGTDAAGGQKAGENGQDGAKGGDGTNGGTIRIVAEQILGTPILIANGGPGGRGQNGGKGAKGKKGDPGRDEGTITQFRGMEFGGTATYGDGKGGPGETGKNGGNGGRAGQRGDHGAGGEIHIESVQKCQPGDLQANPGQCGLTTADKEATPGTAGERGDGGDGGFHYPPSTRYAPGNPGSPGAAGDSPLEAVKGEPGRISVKRITYADLCCALAGQAINDKSHGNPDSAILSMVLFAAERLYLNLESAPDVDALKEVLDYLIRLTADPAVGAPQPKISAIHERCSLLRANLSCGLDYHGRTPDFVPSLSLEANQAFYSNFMETAKDLEADYDGLWAEDAKQKNWKDKLEKKISASLDRASELQPKKNALEAAAREMYVSINSLTTQAITQFSTVTKRQEEFRTELESRHQWDMMLGLVQMAWSVVMVGVNGKSLITEGWPLLQDIVMDAAPGGTDTGEKSEKDKEKEKEEKREKGEKQERVVGAFGKVKGNLEACYDLYKKCFKSEDWKSDTLKIVPEDLDKEKFDEEIDSYMDVSGARELKEEVHKYLDLVAQRNKAIMEHDSVVLQAKNIQAQIEFAEKDAAEVGSQIQTLVDPQRPIFVQYLRSCKQLVASYIIESLYMMHRSADYCTLTRLPMRLSDYRVSTLEKQYADTLHRLQKAAEDIGAPSDNKYWMEINDESQLKRLRQGRPIWFCLPVNTNAPPTGPFAGVERPMVHAVECYFTGLKAHPADSSVIATVKIMHSGASYIYNEAGGEIWSFAPAPRAILFQYRISDRKKESSGDLTDRRKYIMLSPFALWGLELSPDEGQNAKLDLSTIEKVELVFTAKGKTIGAGKVWTHN